MHTGGRFSELEISFLREKSIDIDLAEQYSPAFNAPDIYFLQNPLFYEGLKRRELKTALKELRKDDPYLYNNRKTLLSVINEDILHGRLKTTISVFEEKGAISPPEANSFPPSFLGPDHHFYSFGGDLKAHQAVQNLLNMVSVGMSGEAASDYQNACFGLSNSQKIPSIIDIVVFYRLGIPPSTLLGHLEEGLKGIITDIPMYFFHDLWHDPLVFGILPKPKYRFLSITPRSILFKNTELSEVMKIAPLSSYEYKVGSILGSPRNVVNVTNCIGSCRVHMLSIEGESLDEVLDKSALSKERTLKYCSEILSGLEQMRAKGIYFHMDLRPSNIIIDKYDEAIIIDLATASSDLGAKVQTNRRYRGPGNEPNDLVSLGQLMYRMATGKHPFSEPGSNEGEVQADRIMEQRERVYKDSGKLGEFVAQLEHDIPWPEVREIIKACLTAGLQDHAIVRRIFKKYGLGK